MKILTRYVFREFLVPYTYCLIGFLSIYVLFELFGSFGRLMESDLPFSAVVRFFAGYLAPFFHYLAPAALMLATLYTMWNFCRHSELVAMRASGIGFLTIVKPVLTIAFLTACFVAWVNECYMPRQSQWAKRLKAARFDVARAAQADEIVYENSRDNRTWTADALADDTGAHLQNVRIVVSRPDGTRRSLVTAEKADYLDGEWWFVNAHVSAYDTNGVEAAAANPELAKLKLRVFPEFRERPGDILVQNRDWQYSNVRQKLRFLRRNSDFSPAARRDGLYDAVAQIMSPFACILITFLAIPAGIASGRQSVFKGILGALGLFFAFYGVVIAGMVAAKQGWIPPIPAAIAPYILFFLLGLRAFYRQR